MTQHIRQCLVQCRDTVVFYNNFKRQLFEINLQKLSREIFTIINIIKKNIKIYYLYRLNEIDYRVQSN